MEMSQAFVFTHLGQSTQNCKQNYPSTFWTLCASTSDMLHLKKVPKPINLSGCQILGIPTTGNVWYNATIYYVTHSYENNGYLNINKNIAESN